MLLRVMMFLMIMEETLDVFKNLKNVKTSYYYHLAMN